MHEARMTKVSVDVDTNPEARTPLIIVVDDDPDVREALCDLFLSVGLETLNFGSTRELLEIELPDRPACLILDVRLPGSSGLDLQNQLRAKGSAIPIVFLTGHGDIPMTVQAMKAGATDFLTKPVRDQTLLDAVAEALEAAVARRSEAAEIRKNLSFLKTLTSREKQVLHLVVKGQRNKQVAFALGISEITVKLHRANAMKKLGASSIADLVRTWESLRTELGDALEV